MKKEILQSIKIIVLGLILSLGVSALYAQNIPGWNPAPSNPPADNVAGPIHSGGDQVKQGGLSVNGLFAGNSVFHGSVSLDTLSGQTGNDPLCVDGNGTIKICGANPLSAGFSAPAATCAPWPHQNCRVYVIAAGGVPPYHYDWIVNGTNYNNHGSYFDFGTMQSAQVTVAVSDSASPNANTNTLSGSFNFVTGTGYGSQN